MNDDEVQAKIEALEAEERQLRADEADAADHDRTDKVAADANRLGDIRIELDVLWDYLRQRRARRDAGEDPDGATLRDPGTVEGYEG